MDYSPAFNDFQFDQSEHYASPMSLPPSRTPRGDDRTSMIYRPSPAENPAPSNHPATPQSVPVHEPVSTVPLTPRTVDPIRLQPTLQNIVSTVNLGCRLDLKRIAHQAGNAEYNPKRFSAVIMRIRNPRTTLLIFESGKLVCTGAKTVEDSNRAARRGARIIQKLGFDAKFLEFRIQNMVASVDVNFKIHLTALNYGHPKFCKFEPELFPGAIYRIKNPKIVLLIFDSGKVILTGAKTAETIYKAFDLIYPVLKGFRRS